MFDETEVLSKQAKPKIYSVTELNSTAQDLLESSLSHVWVEGEISNYRGVSSSGHCYFTIKDAGAQLDVAAFRGVMQSLRFKLADGLKILLLGKVTLYPARGRYQIVASAIEPAGIGALQLAFEELKKKLGAEGLFEASRKKPIPPFPQKIGVVTSPTGAAIRDILSVIQRRFASVEILIYPARVQGDGSKEEIAAGVRYLNQKYPNLDVLLVGRGGGSIEDLWAFNEEIVVRAIAESAIPVISCVGHEVDFTIADFVADLRAPTPSAAAELVVKNKAELLQTLGSLRSSLKNSLESKLSLLKEKLRTFQTSSAFAKPRNLIESRMQTLDFLSDNLEKSLDQFFISKERRLEILKEKILFLSPRKKLEEESKLLAPFLERLVQSQKIQWERKVQKLHRSVEKLEALSPLAVLSRGYAIAWSIPAQKIIKSYADAPPGTELELKLGKGRVRALVKENQDD